MKIPRIAWVLLLLVGALAVIAIPKAVTRRTPAPPEIPTTPRNSSSPGITAPPDEKVAKQIRGALENFRAHPDQASSQLHQLRAGIRAAPEEAAAAAIIAFLKTGEDSPTRLPFTVGPDGMMDTVPTLRAALLDLLPELDPLAALAVARDVMDERKSPDEYALALRNLAWNDLDGDLRAELTGRFLDLLESPWLASPSAGFLEAFDIAVEIGGGPMFDRMVSVARLAESNPAASRAAFISLDRMVLRDPALLTAAYSGDTGWMDFAPRQRASLMSRLDITRPEQREIFNRYLSSPLAAEEADYFTRIFPNVNFLYGHRLVTADDSTPSIAEVAAADARVLGELEVLETTATGEAKAAIEKIRDRLKRR